MPVTLDTQPIGPGVSRVRASDLQQATAVYNRMHAEDHNAVVSLDLEFVIAPTAHAARTTPLDDRPGGDASTPTVRYVGTPLGLAGLIADVGAARVADGVNLIPLDNSASAELLVSSTLPKLVGDGVVDSETAAALCAAARRASR
ncbi:hypothetical protein HQO82_12385 [Rhodococcus fascians]|nr:hypothetical protein [Rhodococcus fascians]MBY4114623.1 hypothetical protein [Rhodococcus fascians]